MRSSVGAAALACAIAVVEAAGPFKWHQNEARKWHPARETGAMEGPEYMPNLVARDPFAFPLPTPAPKVEAWKLERRASTDNTCAYVSGEADQSLYCNPDSACVFNSVRSKIGCCPDSSLSCPIWTTCMDRSQSDSFTTDNGYTLWCGNSTYPSCLQHIYSDNVFSGYTLFGCGRTGGSDVVFYSPTGGGTSTTRTRTSSTTTSPTGQITITQPPGPTTSQASGGGGAPVGAIVGGVVGGVGGLALIGAAAFLILRRKRSNAAHTGNSSSAPAMSAYNQPPPPGAPGGATTFPPQSPMYTSPNPNEYGAAGLGAGVAGAGAYAAVDNRSSVAKPFDAQNYNGAYAGYPPQPSPQPHSPPPPSSPGGTVYNTGAYGQQAPYLSPQPTGTSMNASYGPGMGHQSGPVPQTYVAELPSQRGDRELRELE